MIIKKKENKTIEVDTIYDVLCNKCGKSMVFGDDIKFCEGTLLRASFGYGSNKDGLSEKSDICDDCYDEIVESFKHEPEEDIWW